MDDGSDKLHDPRREIEEMIHEVDIKLSKVDERIEDNTDTNTEEFDELAANVRDSLGRVKEKIEHHKDNMAKSIRLLREDMDDTLEKCNTNMGEKIEKKATHMHEEVQSDWVQYRDDVDGKYRDMVNRLQTGLADQEAERMYGSMPTQATTKRRSPITKAMTTFAMSMDAPRDDEETIFDTESIEGLNRSVASGAVRLRASPSWMPAPFQEFLYCYNSPRDTPLQFGCQQIEWLFTEDEFLVPGRALQPPASRKGRTIRPTGIWECAAFLEVRPERQYGTETHALDPEKRNEPGMFGKDAKSWIDGRTKGNIQNDGKVPHWDCEPDTKEKWMKAFLQWEHRRKGCFTPESQVEVLMSVLDDKTFKEAKESQLEDEGVEDDFAAAGQIVTGSLLPHEYKAKTEFKGLVIDTFKDMKAEARVVF